MRDEDGVQIFGVLTNGREPGENVALAETGVDKDACFFCSDEGGISRAATGENADFDYDVLRELFKRLGITLNVVFTGRLLLPILAQPRFPTFAGGGVTARKRERLDFRIGNGNSSAVVLRHYADARIA
jgi:hypothetical protein